MIACFDIDHFSEHEDRLFERPNINCRIYLTKHPADLFVVKPSIYFDPELYIICLIRDPRDSIVSRHSSDPDIYWCSLRYWQRFLPIARSLKKHSRFIIVRYEDLVSDPDLIQKQIHDRIPFLRKNYNFTQFHEVATPSKGSLSALNQIRPIQASGIGNWKHHLPRVKQQLDLHGDITASLIEMGYEKDDSWLHQLDDIAAYDGKSHWPEYFTQQDIRAREAGRYKEIVRILLRRFGLMSQTE